MITCDRQGGRSLNHKNKVVRKKESKRERVQDVLQSSRQVGKGSRLHYGQRGEESKKKMQKSALPLHGIRTGPTKKQNGGGGRRTFENEVLTTQSRKERKKARGTRKDGRPMKHPGGWWVEEQEVL